MQRRLTLIIGVAVAVAGCRSDDRIGERRLAVELHRTGALDSTYHVLEPHGGAAEFQLNCPAEAARAMQRKLHLDYRIEGKRVIVAPRLDGQRRLPERSARVNERITFSREELFGCELKTELRIVEAGGPRRVSANVSSRMRSMEIVRSVETLEGQEIELRNVSHRAVVALAIACEATGNRWTEDAGGKGALMTPGASHTVRVGFCKEAGGGLVVEGVQFDDGTYEGDEKDVAGLRSCAIACEAWRQRVRDRTAVMARDSGLPDDAKIALFKRALTELAADADPRGAGMSACLDRKKRRVLESLKELEGTGPTFGQASTRRSFAEWWNRL